MSICYEEIRFESDACDICETMYDKIKITDYGWDEYQPPGTRTDYESCPGCGYNPDIINKVGFIIQKDAEFTIKYRGNFREKTERTINSEELSDKIFQMLREYWPRE